MSVLSKPEEDRAALEAEQAQGAGGPDPSSGGLGSSAALRLLARLDTWEPCPEAFAGVHREERWPGSRQGSCPHFTREEVVVQEQDQTGIELPWFQLGKG